MFIPTNAKPLGKLPESPVRLALIGASGSGKTHSAIRTAPNPLVLDFDNNLKGHQQVMKDVPSVPFWSSETWAELAASYPINFRNVTTKEPNKPACFLRYMSELVPQLSPEQTLILDSWTTIQDMRDMHDWPEVEAKKIDGFKFWGNKLTWSTMLINILKSTPCNVIVTIHENRENDPDTGKPSGKIVPLMQGSFRDKLLAHFTDTIRCVRRRKTDGDRKSELVYKWQTKAEDIDLKTRIVGCPEIIEPSFAELLDRYKEEGAV